MSDGAVGELLDWVQCRWPVLAGIAGGIAVVVLAYNQIDNNATAIKQRAPLYELIPSLQGDIRRLNERIGELDATVTREGLALRDTLGTELGALKSIVEVYRTERQTELAGVRRELDKHERVGHAQ